MPLYSVGNRILDSNISLPGLAESRQGTPQHTFRVRPVRAGEPGSFRWFHHWCGSDDQIWLSFARHESGYILRFADLADFHLTANATQIDCFPEPGTSIDTISHLLLDQVFPLVLSRLGSLVVHASAVVAPEGAIAFVGSTGRGKSTLAASFALRGFPLMTDDCLLLEEAESGLVVTPSYPGARLWDDSIETLFEHAPRVWDVAHYTAKKRLALNNGQVHFCATTVRLRRMYFLVEPEKSVHRQAIEMTPLAAREAFVELVSYSFKLDVDDRNVLEREFRLLDRVASLPLFYRLAYPHDFSMLPAVRQAILDHLRHE